MGGVYGPSSSVLGLKIAFLDKIVIFRLNIELEAIARQSVEASHKVDCAYFGNIGRNSGYFLLPIFLGSYLNEHGDVSSCICSNWIIMSVTHKNRWKPT